VLWEVLWDLKEEEDIQVKIIISCDLLFDQHYAFRLETASGMYSS